MSFCDKFLYQINACTCGCFSEPRQRKSIQKKRRRNATIILQRRSSVFRENAETQYKFYNEPKVSSCWKFMISVVNFFVLWTIPTLFLFVGLTLLNCRNIVENGEKTEAHEVVEVFGTAVVFLLSLAFNSGINKYKETLKMYDEITGDIKALAMIMVHLTFDREKYSIQDNKLNYKKDVPDQYKKIKYLLASIAPTVKNVLTAGTDEKIRKIGSNGCCATQITPIEAISERAYYMKNKSWWSIITGEYTRIPNYWKDANDDEQSEPLTILGFNQRLSPPERDLQSALYKKIKDVHDHSNMDAFECTMTVLLDELMRVFENGLGFGSDEGSAIATSAIEKWNSIYGTWGKLSSLKTFREPLLVSLLRVTMLAAYAWYTPTKYSKYIDDEGWFYIYAVSDVCFFAWLNWISYAIRNPFKDSNRWIIDTVDGPAIQTQSQVIYFMSRSYSFDSSDYKPFSRFGYVEDREKRNPIGFEKIEDIDFLLESILKNMDTTPSVEEFKKYLRRSDLNEEKKKQLLEKFKKKRVSLISEEKNDDSYRLHYRGTSLEF